MKVKMLLIFIFFISVNTQAQSLGCYRLNSIFSTPYADVSYEAQINNLDGEIILYESYGRLAFIRFVYTNSYIDYQDFVQWANEEYDIKLIKRIPRKSSDINSKCLIRYSVVKNNIEYVLEVWEQFDKPSLSFYFSDLIKDEKDSKRRDKEIEEMEELLGY